MMNTDTLDRFPEQKISVDLEPFEILSDTSSIDFDQADSVNSTESSYDKSLDSSELEIAETESNVSYIDETSFSETEREPEKELFEAKSNKTGQEISKLASDVPETRLSESNLDIVKEVTELASATPEKQLLESNSATGEDTKLSNKASDSQLLVSDAGEKIPELNAGEELNRDSLHTASKVLGYYEKQKNPDTFRCFKSTVKSVVFSSCFKSTEGEFQSDSQMECNATDNCNRGSSSETICNTYGNSKVQKESNLSKQNTEETKCQASDICRPSSEIESDLLNISRSSSLDRDLGCGDDGADSHASNSLPDDKSNILKHDHVQKDLKVSESSFKSLLEDNLNVTKYDSEIVKSCYVKIQDIFKSLLDSKVSTQKIFSWKKKYHVCNVCDKFFRLRSDLNIHYLIHTTVKPYACNLCDKSFVKQCNLFTHQLVHTIRRKHVCSICRKSFLKKSLLLRHKLIHTKEKPFACEKCDKSYASKWSLSEHYLTHSSERPHICEICSTSFANKRYLRRHYYTHQNKNENHVCEFCYRPFKRKHHLEEHYNIHINDRPHQCKICNKSFHLLLTLNNHYTVVHRDQYSRIFSEAKKTISDCKTDKNPFIQKIEVSAEVEPKKTPVEKPIIHIKKETPSYSRARRKSKIPKKYLQSDNFFCIKKF